MSTPPVLKDYLLPGLFVDSEHAAIVETSQSLIDDQASPVENAVTLFYRVRDLIRYNPYALSSDRESFKASATLQAGEGWCVPKAILLAALCRAAGIPARLGFADVRNHLSTERLRQTMQTDVFYFHGYTSIFLNEKWIKATPAFNIELCKKFGLRPLEFDGLEDSLYHEFDVAGNKHMEYLNDRGEYLDLPFDEMAAVFHQYYPGLFGDSAPDKNSLPDAASWSDDVDRELGLI
jgi:transglutaminase-like putative cysteine protease